MSESELKDQLVVLLSGRAAEKLIYNEVSVGAENDLERATNLARRMVMNWGMSPRLGPVCYKVTDDDPFLGREIHQSRQFSEHTMEAIDEEVVSILTEASQRATQLLEDKNEALVDLTRALIDSEELDRFAIEKVIGPSVHQPPVITKTADKESSAETSSDAAQVQDEAQNEAENQGQVDSDDSGNPSANE